MDDQAMTEFVEALARDKRIAAKDVLTLRKEVFGDSLASRTEVECLFALDAVCTEKCAEWIEFFIEAVTDYVVHQELPRGHISRENAAWLISLISSDGVVDTTLELELLIKILEQAKSSPEELSAYALGQVALAVVEGNGPLAKANHLTPGVIEEAEVELLRRILYAFGGDGNVAVTRAEADVLIKINERTVEEMNAPAWNELFVKAIASFVLSASGYVPPRRDEALRHEAFFNETTPNIGGFFSRMVSGGFAAIAASYEKNTDVEDAWAERNRAHAETSARIDDAEAQWLVKNFGGGRLLHDNERAVLSFIKQHANSVHPDLAPLFDKVA